MTAHQGLFEHGLLKPGDRVMINGGSSSVGAIAIQLAKYSGATVITSCSGPKTEMVKGFGADEVSLVQIIVDQY
jgi:NADPH:quinone reductase-like Zn-dependent oxidoreductase